jgi:hypothetical protein
LGAREVERRLPPYGKHHHQRRESHADNRKRLKNTRRYEFKTSQKTYYIYVYAVTLVTSVKLPKKKLQLPEEPRRKGGQYGTEQEGPDDDGKRERKTEGPKMKTDVDKLILKDF